MLGPWGQGTPLPRRKRASLLLETLCSQISQKICAQLSKPPSAVIVPVPQRKHKKRHSRVTQVPAFLGFLACMSFSRAASKTEPASSPAERLTSSDLGGGKESWIIGCI